MKSCGFKSHVCMTNHILEASLASLYGDSQYVKVIVYKAYTMCPPPLRERVYKNAHYPANQKGSPQRRDNPLSTLRNLQTSKGRLTLFIRIQGDLLLGWLNEAGLYQPEHWCHVERIVNDSTKDCELCSTKMAAFEKQSSTQLQTRGSLL